MIKKYIKPQIILVKIYKDYYLLNSSHQSGWSKDGEQPTDIEQQDDEYDISDWMYDID